MSLAAFLDMFLPKFGRGSTVISSGGPSRRYLPALLLGGLLAGGTLAAQDTPAEPGVIKPDDKNLLYVGRWDRLVPTNSHGNWIGSYVRVGFTGTSVAAKVGGHSSLVYSIDGQAPQVTEGGPGLIPLAATPLTDGPHTLLLATNAGGGWDFQGLKLDASGMSLAVPTRPIIECIGDSITTSSPGPIGTAGNYNWLVAESLGCDHTQICWPGRALTTGYGCQGDKVGLDIQFFQQNCFYDSPKISWTFDTYTPAMVVINLGQNDACGNEPSGVFTDSYVSFLTNIRAKYAKTPIVCLTPFSGNFHDEVVAAVQAVNNMGDPLIYCVDTKGWLQMSDFKDGVHPNVPGNAKVAGLLRPYLVKFSKCPVDPGAPKPPEPVTVGDPNNPAGLFDAIQQAYDGGARNIVVTPGEYVLPDVKHPALLLRKWKYITLNVARCIFTYLGDDDIFNLTECRHVTLKGPAIARHAVPCGTQGRITAMGNDGAGHGYCDWQVDAGYGTNTKGFDNFDVVHAETRKLGACDLRNFKIEPLGDSKFRIHWPDAHLRMKVNDWLVHRYHAPGCAVRVSNSRDTIIDGITSENGGHATFFESDGSGADHFLNCGIACGPKPAGATEEQLVSNWADGFHSVGAFPGPDIENFTDAGVILDDTVAIHGGFNHIISSNPAGKTVTLDDAPGWLVKVGEPLRVVSDTFYGEANVVAIKDEDGHKVLTLDSALAAPAKADCVDPLRCGAYYRVVNSHIGGTRSRGILAKADGGLICNDTFADCGTGILLGPGGGEAGYFQDATVVGNLVTGCQGVGMSFESNDHIVLRGVRIFRNHFDNNPAWDGDLHLCLLDGAQVSWNLFTPPPNGGENGRKPPIWVERAHSVTISDNKIESPDLYAQPLLRVGSDVPHLKEDITAASP